MSKFASLISGLKISNFCLMLCQLRCTIWKLLFNVGFILGVKDSA